MKKYLKISPSPAGLILATAATIIWSWNYIIARGLHDVIPPASLSFYRWLVAALVLLPFALGKVVKEYQVIKMNWRYITTTAFFGVTVFNTLIYLAGRTTDAINLSLIAISSPIFIVIFSLLFYRTRVGIRKISGIVITITGIVLLLTKGDMSILTNISFAAGDLWMLIAAMTFAVYSMLIIKRPIELSRTSFLFTTFTAGLIMLLPFYLSDLIFRPYPFFNSELIISILYVGIFASVAAFFLWNRAIELIGPSNAGLIYYTLPLFSTLWAILFLNERAEAVHFLSMLLILSGIIIARENDKKLTNIAGD